MDAVNSVTHLAKNLDEKTAGPIRDLGLNTTGLVSMKMAAPKFGAP